MLSTKFPVSRVLLFLIFILIAKGVVDAQNSEDGAAITVASVQSRMQLVQNAVELSDSVKALVLEQYRQAIADLELAKSYEERKQALQEAFRRTPAEVEAIRDAISQQREVDPTRNLRFSNRVSEEELERLLQQELVDQNAAELKLNNVETTLEAEQQRPSQIRDRIVTARLLLEEANRRKDLSGATGSDPLLAEASRWAAEARILALQAEISMLDQELLGKPSRVRLLRYQQEEAAQNLSRVQRRLEVIQAAMRSRRQEELGAAVNQADSILRADPPLPEALRQIAESNLELVATREEQLVLLDSIDRVNSRVRPFREQLTNAFSSAKQKLELQASDAPLGRIIREERARFPSKETLVRARKNMDQEIAKVSLRLIESEDERRTMRDLGSYLDKWLAKSFTDTLDAEGRSRFEELAMTRRELLDLNISNDVNLERKLYALSELLDELIQKTEAYDTHLKERLLWVRSATPFQRSSFSNLGNSLRTFLNPDHWAGCGRNLVAGLREHLWLLLLFITAIILLLLRVRILRALSATGQQAWNIWKDHISHVFIAIGYSVLLAVPIPLILWASGTSIRMVAGPEEVSAGISRGLILSSYLLGLLLFFRGLFFSEGVAHYYGGWAKSRVMGVRQLLNRLIMVGMPFYFLTVAFVNVFPPTQGGGLALLSFSGYMLVLSWFGLALRRLISERLKEVSNQAWRRWYRFVFFVVIVLPPVLAAMVWLGYTYTAVEFYFRLEWSAWLIAGLWLTSVLARRWLLIMRNKLLLQAIEKERGTTSREEASEVDAKDEIPRQQPEDAHEELENLDNDTRRLFNATFFVAMFLGLIAIWGKVMPALGILDEIRIWDQRITIDGVEQLTMITLADFLKAIFYGVIAYILGNNLPSLINILLIKNGKTSSGTRYAVATLLKYAIVLFGVLAVLSALGATTAQLGWAAAALSVGIGFGLQEIVANFVSGIILLFERPVRIGDVVTIGEASGIVTRIHIRATTIRDWDRKELLVPNKELITGRLVNWTLSDNVIRIQIKVGVAYGSDVEKAMELMLDVANSNKLVLKNPAPFTWFEQFGDSTLNLTLNAFVGDISNRMGVITDLNRAIDQSFKEASIKIAFPQVDVHLHSKD